MLFFFWKGARSSSIVGTALFLGFEVSEICRLIEGLKNGVDGFGRLDLAHDVQTQAASLRPRPDNKRGKVFIVFVLIKEAVLDSSDKIKSKHGQTFFRFLGKILKS